MKLTNLKTKFLGRNNIYYETIDSTQDEIWRLYETNPINGILVIAEKQIKGRGTHGRIWHTEKNNIAFSFLIKPECNIKKLEGLTSEIANIILNIFQDLYNIKISIKNPNDIVYNNKKIGGILTETKVEKEIVKGLVIGIGINTYETIFCKDIENIATSIKKEFNINVDNEKIIEEFCNRFEKIILERINK